MSKHPDFILAAVAKNHPRQVALPSNKVSLAEACGFTSPQKAPQPTFKETIDGYAAVVASEKWERAFIEGMLADTKAKPKGASLVTVKFLSACLVRTKPFAAGEVATFDATTAKELLRARRVEVVQQISQPPLEPTHRKIGWARRMFRRGGWVSSKDK